MRSANTVCKCSRLSAFANMVASSRHVALGLLLASGCGGGSSPAWLATETSAKRTSASASAVCRASEPIPVEAASIQCCMRVPSIGPSTANPKLPPCVAPEAADGQVTLLACLDGDPANITGMHRMADGSIAILTTRSEVCGGMARSHASAYWVSVPKGHATAMALCSFDSERCSGAPRP